MRVLVERVRAPQRRALVQHRGRLRAHRVVRREVHCAAPHSPRESTTLQKSAQHLPDMYFRRSRVVYSNALQLHHCWTLYMSVVLPTDTLGPGCWLIGVMCAHTLLVRSHPGAVMGLRRTGYLATHDCSSAFRNKTKRCYAPGGDILSCKVGHGVDLGHHRLRAEVHARACPSRCLRARSPSCGRRSAFNAFRCAHALHLLGLTPQAGQWVSSHSWELQGAIPPPQALGG